MSSRQRVTVRGPDVTGEVSAADIELYLGATGWELRAAWFARGAGQDERLVPAPRGELRPRLEEVLQHIATAEHRTPGEVLRDVEGHARATEEGPECPGEHCKMCNGEACNKCGAGCWNHDPYGSPPCEHDVDERHQEPETRAASGGAE